jgi:hypothetical protein
MVGNDVSQFFNTPQRKIVGGLTAVATIALCVKYPKIGIPLLTGAVAALPTVIYETPTIQEVFGVSHGSVIKIHLPQIDPQIVMEDERILHELKEKIRKDDGFNRVA